MNKGQSSIEFIILLGGAFLFFIIFLTAMLAQTAESNEEEKNNQLKEVALSIDIAYQLCDLFIEYNVDMEVHADINTNLQFKSNEALKDAMGYIMGMGFAFKAKPDSFASSCCADKVLN